MKFSKAQIFGQVLVYVLVLAIVSFILVYGYKAIEYFNDRAEYLTMVELENQLKHDFNSIRSDYGTQKIGEYTLPSEFEGICFINSIRFSEVTK